MNCEDSEYIRKMSDSIFRANMIRLKDIAEYFREDSSGAAKCLTIHHLVIVQLICSYVNLIEENGNRDIEDICANLYDDVLEIYDEFCKNLED